MAILTIWHNNIGRPVTYGGGRFPEYTYEGRSGISPFDPESEACVAEWRRTVERFGHAIVESNRACRPINHNVAGIGAGHNDADWCESRFREGSQAAWIENGESGREDIWPREIEALRIARREAVAKEWADARYSRGRGR